MVQPIKVAIIGAGRWGTNYLRTFNELKNAEVKWLCSPREITIKKALSNAKSKSEAKSTTDYREILEDERVDAVAIASSGSTHYEIAKAALQSGKHVLVEKPLALSIKEAKELVKISKQKKKILMVGHIHRYNPGIQKLKEDICMGLFGRIKSIHFLHFGNGPIRSDMNVIWDFFPHTASILLYLLEKTPVSVSAEGKSFINKGIEDIATIDIAFPDKVFASSMASWLYPFKKMGIVIIGEKLCATFDDHSNEEKLKYFGRRFSSPSVGEDRPLTAELKHFLDCIINKKTPFTNGQEGLKVVRVLEAAQNSLIKGKRIKVNFS